MPYTKDGVEYPSVTTILGILDKPALKGWAAGCAVDYVREHLDVIKNSENVHDAETILSDAVYAFKAVSRGATDIGSEVHHAIERYIKHGEDVRGDISDEAQHGFLAFLEWEEKNDVDWLESELTLYHDDEYYAGTCDAIAEIAGNIYLIDFKTSKAVYDEYRYQLAAYQKCRPDVPNVAVLRLDKETGEPEFKDLSYRLDVSKRAFERCTDLYYALKRRRLKNNPRAKEQA